MVSIDGSGEMRGTGMLTSARTCPVHSTGHRYHLSSSATQNRYNEWEYSVRMLRRSWERARVYPNSVRTGFVVLVHVKHVRDITHRLGPQKLRARSARIPQPQHFLRPSPLRLPALVIGNLCFLQTWEASRRPLNLVLGSVPSPRASVQPASADLPASCASRSRKSHLRLV